MLFQLLDTPIEVVPHYLEVSLSNSNPLLHTSRLYNLFQNYREGIYYEKVPLFYEDWTDEDAELLIRCDNEFSGYWIDYRSISGKYSPYSNIMRAGMPTLWH